MKNEFVVLQQLELFQQTFIWRTWGLLTGNLESSLPVETSAQGSGVRSSFNEQKLLCHLTWHNTDRQWEHFPFPCFPCCFVCLLCLCFPVTDRVASGAKRRSPTSACGSRGWNSFLAMTVIQCFFRLRLHALRLCLVCVVDVRVCLRSSVGILMKRWIWLQICARRFFTDDVTELFHRFSLWTGPFRVLFSKGRPYPHVRAAIRFWGCDVTVGTHPAASKVRHKPWNHKRQEGWHKHPRAELGSTTSWSPKSVCGPKNEIATVTVFVKMTQI